MQGGGGGGEEVTSLGLQFLMQNQLSCMVGKGVNKTLYKL
jgi:hypothetical protein